MMNPAYFQELYDYNYWAHRRVWELITPLTAAQFNQELDYPKDSLRMQCVHLMAVESWWFHFLQTGELAFLDQEAYTTRDAVRAQWDGVETRVRAYLVQLTPIELEREVRPEFWDEDARPIKMWQVLVQVANHSTDHRAQIMAGLHRLNVAGVEQDFLGYLFAKQKA